MNMDMRKTLHFCGYNIITIIIFRTEFSELRKKTLQTNIDYNILIIDSEFLVRSKQLSAANDIYNFLTCMNTINKVDSYTCIHLVN